MVWEYYCDKCHHKWHHTHPDVGFCPACGSGWIARYDNPPPKHAGHVCPYCGHKSMQINYHYNHMETCEHKK